MPLLNVLASVFGAVLVLVSTLAQVQPRVAGELNLAKAARQLKTWGDC